MNRWMVAQLSQCIGHSWWIHLKTLEWLNEQLIGSFTFKGNSVPINSHTAFPLKFLLALSSVQSLSRVWLCDPMNHSTPGLPVHYQPLEFTQTHVHQVSDAIQPSHPLSSPSPAPNPSQHQSFPMNQLFAWGGQSTGVSALASFLPENTQDWSAFEWTGWISL